MEPALVDYAINGLFGAHQFVFLRADEGSSSVSPPVPTSLCFSRLLGAPRPPVIAAEEPVSADHSQSATIAPQVAGELRSLFPKLQEVGFHYAT